MKRTVSIALFSLACLAASWLVQPHLAETREKEDHGMTAAVEDAPPLLVFTTVYLGGLRGLAIDVLWSRIMMLQNRGNYVEVVQLSDWITKLEPRLGDVWRYHSDNMTYNISVMFYNPEDRWRWVSAGMSILRDEALEYNPDDVVLYDRMCRIYEFKFVDGTDAAADYYKSAWAQEMEDLLGDGHVDYDDICSDPALVEQMADKYRLDPKIMRETDELYGPLDWQLPGAHMLYWAHSGCRNREEVSIHGFDGIVLRALLEVVLKGRIVDHDREHHVLVTAPDFEVLPKALRFFEIVLAREKARGHRDTPVLDLYIHFLRHCLLAAREHGHDDETAVLFARIKELDCEPEASGSLDSYIRFLESLPELTEPPARGEIHHHCCDPSHHH